MQVRDETITQAEQEGVRMIQALRKFLGERESEAVSLRHWRTASDQVRNEVRRTYKELLKKQSEE
jgi:hypothetical protein